MGEKINKRVEVCRQHGFLEFHQEGLMEEWSWGGLRELDWRRSGKKNRSPTYL